MEMLDDGSLAIYAAGTDAIEISNGSLVSTAVAYYSGVINEQMSQASKVSAMFRHGLSFTDDPSMHPLPAQEWNPDHPNGLKQNFKAQARYDRDGGYQERAKKLAIYAIPPEVFPGKLVISKDITAKTIAHLMQIRLQRNGKTHAGPTAEHESMYDHPQLSEWILSAIVEAKKERDHRRKTPGETEQIAA